MNIRYEDCIVSHKELWFYLMYYIRDIMKRNTPNAMNAARIVSIKKGVLVELQYLFYVVRINLQIRLQV